MAAAILLWFLMSWNSRFFHEYQMEFIAETWILHIPSLPSHLLCSYHDHLRLIPTNTSNPSWKFGKRFLENQNSCLRQPFLDSAITTKGTVVSPTSIYKNSHHKRERTTLWGIMSTWQNFKKNAYFFSSDRRFKFASSLQWSGTFWVVVLCWKIRKNE